MRQPRLPPQPVVEGALAPEPLLIAARVVMLEDAEIGAAGGGVMGQIARQMRQIGQHHVIGIQKDHMRRRDKRQAQIARGPGAKGRGVAQDAKPAGGHRLGLGSRVAQQGRAAEGRA